MMAWTRPLLGTIIRCYRRETTEIVEQCMGSWSLHCGIFYVSAVLISIDPTCCLWSYLKYSNTYVFDFLRFAFNYGRLVALEFGNFRSLDHITAIYRFVILRVCGGRDASCSSDLARAYSESTKCHPILFSAYVTVKFSTYANRFAPVSRIYYDAPSISHWERRTL